MHKLLWLPGAVQNPVSLLGSAIVTAMATLFVVLVLLDLLGYLTNPYLGLLVFITVPAIFVAGLLLIPYGAWRAARRRRRAPAEIPDWPVIDLRQPRQRGILLGVVALTVANLVIVSMAAYGGVHYLESAEFCGQVCHTTMEPEYAAYEAWPHASVACTACHVGPGAGALVESKLAGSRQLLHVVTGRVPRPVPSPVSSMRPARETCEQCHWSEKFHGDRIRVIRQYAADEENSEFVTTLELHVGGGQQSARNRERHPLAYEPGQPDRVHRRR